MPVLSSAGHQLLRETILKHRPDCLPVVDQLGRAPLQAPVREELRDAVVAELCATGFDEHDEPNRRGRELERLIDILGHL